MPLCEGKALSGRALILTKEDDPNRIVHPRLEAAGGDVMKALIVGFDEPGDPEEFDTAVSLDEKLDELEQLIIKYRDIRIIAIDPASDFCGKHNPNEEKPVRDFLSPLAKLARKHNVAVVVIIHCNKNPDQSADQRGLGSVAWFNVPRSALLVADDPDVGGRKLLAQTKANLTEFSRSALGFTVRTVDGLGCGAIDWEEELCCVDLEKLMAKRRQKTKLEQAKEYLEEWLKDGSQLVDDLKYLAESENIGWRTIVEAKKQLHVRSFKRKGETQWRWKLPKRRT